ncbi:MAG: 50S ribosomal protein L30 [Actinobacteria bacterium]|nr:50S ribosomal protein L30 [Actinomycetota bacterium]
MAEPNAALRITQIRSLIGRPRDQRDTVRTLGLRRIRHTVVHPDRPEIRGMIRKVAHLVEFEVVEADARANDKDSS